MSHLDRRTFLSGTAATAAALAASTIVPSPVPAQTPAPAPTPKKGGTLRFVPIGDLKIIDPIWTTAYITRDHGYMIYDTLFALDASLQPRPQMVDKHTVSRDQMKWSFTLRDGLRFHDGQPVTAEDCVASLLRWGKRDALGRLMLAATGKLQATDRKTFTLELKSPFGIVLEALAKPSSNVPFIMPARLAATPETEQVKEPIGSGPFRFLKEQWQPGHEAVYVKNTDYVPRSEPASGAAGGKVVHLDRVVWRYQPDQATAAAAMGNGELDYWWLPSADYVTRLEKHPNIQVFVSDPVGIQGWLRPNHVHPPFDNKKARQALLYLMDQELWLQAAVGQPKFYRTCPAFFMCGNMPYESSAGAPRPDLDRARQLLREGGYDGRPLVVLDPTDRPEMHGACLVLRDQLQKIGARVDLVSLDWSTVIARRAEKKPPAAGGWNLMHATWISSDVNNPAVNIGLSGACDKAWFGWSCSEQMEKLRGDWLRAGDLAQRKQIAEQVQLLAYDEVPYLPWGQYLAPSLYRKQVKGVLNFPAALLWNVWLDA